MSNQKTIFFVLVGFVAAVTLLTVIPQWSTANAQEPGGQAEGAWIGTVIAQANGSSLVFPFLAQFNRDGTWTSDDARAFGAIPPVLTKSSILIGSWVRMGGRKVVWRGVEILFGDSSAACGPLPAPCYFLLKGEGSHEIAPGDPDHAINGKGTTLLFACTPTPSGPLCPSWDAIVSGAVSPLPIAFPPFTFALTRIRAQ